MANTIFQFAKKIIFPRPQEASFSSSTYYNFNLNDANDTENMSPLLHIPIVDPVTKEWTGSSTNAYLHLFPDAPYLIIFAHPNAVDIGMITEDMYYLGYYAKMHVLAFEYTGYGLTNKELPSEESMYADGFSAYWFARSVLRVPCHRIILLGRSIGSAVMAHLASHLPPYEEEVKLDVKNREMIACVGDSCTHHHCFHTTTEKNDFMESASHSKEYSSSSSNLSFSRSIKENEEGKNVSTRSSSTEIPSSPPHCYRLCLVVLQCPFTSISECVSSLSGIAYTAKVVDFLGINWFRTLDKIDSILAPVVFHHGTQDKLIPFDHTLHLKSKRDNAARTLVSYLHPEEGRGHNDLSCRFLIDILSSRIDTSADPLPIVFPELYKAHPPIYDEYFSFPDGQVTPSLSSRQREEVLSPSSSTSSVEETTMFKEEKRRWPAGDDEDEKKVQQIAHHHSRYHHSITPTPTEDVPIPTLKDVLAMWQSRPLTLRPFLTSFFPQSTAPGGNLAVSSPPTSSSSRKALSVLLTLSVALFSMRCTRLWQEYIQSRSAIPDKPRSVELSNGTSGSQGREVVRVGGGGGKYVQREGNATSSSHPSTTPAWLHRMSSFFSSFSTSSSPSSHEDSPSRNASTEHNGSPFSKASAAPGANRFSSRTSGREEDIFSSVADIHETMHSREAFLRGCMARWGSPLGVHLTRLRTDPSQLRYVIFGSTMVSCGPADPVIDFSPYLFDLPLLQSLSSSSSCPGRGDKVSEDTVASPSSTSFSFLFSSPPSIMYLATVAELPCTSGLMSVIKSLMSYSSYTRCPSYHKAMGGGTGGEKKSKRESTENVEKNARRGEEEKEGPKCQEAEDVTSTSRSIPDDLKKGVEEGIEKADFLSGIPCFIGKEQVSAIQTECERLIAYLSFDEYLFWENLFCDIFKGKSESKINPTNPSSKIGSRNTGGEEDTCKGSTPDCKQKSTQERMFQVADNDLLWRRLSPACQQYLRSVDQWLMRYHAPSFDIQIIGINKKKVSVKVVKEGGEGISTESPDKPLSSCRVSLAGGRTGSENNDGKHVTERDKNRSLLFPNLEESDHMNNKIEKKIKGVSEENAPWSVAPSSFPSSSLCGTSSTGSIVAKVTSPLEGSMQDIHDYMVQWQPLFQYGYISRFIVPFQKEDELRKKMKKKAISTDFSKLGSSPEISTISAKILCELARKVNWDFYLTKARSSSSSVVPRRDSSWEELQLFFQEHILINQVYELWQTQHNYRSSGRKRCQ